MFSYVNGRKQSRSKCKSRYQIVEVRKCLTNTFDFNINISFTCLLIEAVKYNEKFIEKESSQNIQVNT